MFQSGNILRRLIHYNPIRLSSFRAFSSVVTDQKVHLAPTVGNYEGALPPLEPWSGSNVNAIVHESFENMIPCEVISLPGEIFNAPVRPDLVHRVVTWQLAKRRAGLAKTKSRGEVAGSGRKIRPQKGQGRSRQGAITSPIFRGGGRAHGPVPRSYDFTLPHKVRKNALRSVLTSKLACGQLWIVDSAVIPDLRTKTVYDALNRYEWKTALIVDDVPGGTVGVHPSLYTASHNVRGALAMNALGLNVYDALSFDMLILTKSALQHLSDRYSKCEWLF